MLIIIFLNVAVILRTSKLRSLFDLYFFFKDRRSEVDSRPSLLGPVPAEPSYVERGQRNMSIPLNPPDLLG